MHGRALDAYRSVQSSFKNKKEQHLCTAEGKKVVTEMPLDYDRIETTAKDIGLLVSVPTIKQSFLALKIREYSHPLYNLKTEHTQEFLDQ